MKLKESGSASRAQNVACLGNLKAGADRAAVDDAELTSKSNQDKESSALALPLQPMRGKQFIAAVHFFFTRNLPNILTVVAPRHPSAGHKLRIYLPLRVLAVARRSQREDLNSNHDIYLGDTLGGDGIVLSSR